MADLQRGMREVAVLQEVTRMNLAATTDLDTVLHQVLLVVRNFFGVTNCAIFLVDHSAGYVYCRVRNGYDRKYEGTRYRIGEEGVTGWVAYTRMPMYIPDVSKEPRYFAADPAIRSELALPLMARDELLGVLNIESAQLEVLQRGNHRPAGAVRRPCGGGHRQRPSVFRRTAPHAADRVDGPDRALGYHGHPD